MRGKRMEVVVSVMDSMSLGENGWAEGTLCWHLKGMPSANIMIFVYTFKVCCLDIGSHTFTIVLLCLYARYRAQFSIPTFHMPPIPHIGLALLQYGMVSMHRYRPVWQIMLLLKILPIIYIRCIIEFHSFVYRS